MTRIRQHDARKFARIAQGLGIAALATTIGAAMLIPTAAPERTPPDLTTINLPEKPPAAERVRMDPSSIAERMAVLANAPTPAEAAPDKPDDSPEVDQPENTGPRTLADRLTYLGAMAVGPKRFALLRVDGGRQRVIGPGQPFEVPDEEAELTIRQIRDDALFVARGRATIEVPLEEADPELKQTITTLAPPSSNPLDASRRRGGASSNTDPAVAAETPAQRFREAEAPAEDPLERRRQALERAVQRGSITQEQADEMMQRAQQTRDSRRGNGREN